MLRLMRVVTSITAAPLTSSAMPRPKSASAPVDGVVVLAPCTPLEGFEEVDGLDTWDVVEVEGSVTTVVLALEDSLLVDGSVTTVVLDVDDPVVVDCDDDESLLVDDDEVVSADDVTSLVALEVLLDVDVDDDSLVASEDVVVSEDVVLPVEVEPFDVVLFEVVLFDVVLFDVVLCEVVVWLVDEVGLELDVEVDVDDAAPAAAQVLERVKSPLPAESSAPVPSASVLSPVIADSGTHAQSSVAPPSASTTTPFHPAFFDWT